MKRLLPLFCILSYLLPFQVMAQKKAFKQQLYLGGGGGIIFSNIDFVPTIVQDMHMGLSGGVSFKYITEKHLGLLAEINFTQRGWKEKFEDEQKQNYAFSRALNYAELPIMTHVYFGNKVRFIFNAGPQISFLLGYSDKMNDALKSDIDEQKLSSQAQEQYKKPNKLFDYGLIGGMGIAFQTGKGEINVEGRYYFGLGDIFDSRISTKSYFSRSASHYIGAKITYFIRL